MGRKLNPVTNRPCQHCPFRHDNPGFLSGSRAQEIADSLNRGQSFTCHETDDYDDETGEAVVTIESKHCAGAALMLADNPNQLMQVVQRLGYWVEPEGRELVFESFDEFVRHHSYMEARNVTLTR